jgi:thiamine-monophosphate kinase
VGVGDDAAVVRLDGRDVVVTADALVDGVHFDLRRCGPAAAARKAVAVNVSDLAAMGALPRACVVAVVLPRGTPFRTFDGLARGFAAASRETGCPVVGGDTNVGPGPLVLAVTAFGDVGRGGPVRRAGARPGDVLSVTGPLGGSILGRHLSFRPRVAEGRALAETGVAHAMMDLSDGLSADLPRLCRASGVGARVFAERVPVHRDARRARGRRTALERALDDGEDFELLVAHAALGPAAARALARRGVVLHAIGEATSDSGRVTLVVEGRERRLPPRGFDHLRAGRRSRRG